MAKVTIFVWDDNSDPNTFYVSLRAPDMPAMRKITHADPGGAPIAKSTVQVVGSEPQIKINNETGNLSNGQAYDLAAPASPMKAELRLSLKKVTQLTRKAKTAMRKAAAMKSGE